MSPLEGCSNGMRSSVGRRETLRQLRLAKHDTNLSHLFSRLPCSRGFRGGFRGAISYLIRVPRCSNQKSWNQVCPDPESIRLSHMIVLQVTSSVYVIASSLLCSDRSRQRLDDGRGHTFGQYSKKKLRVHNL